MKHPELKFTVEEQRRNILLRMSKQKLIQLTNKLLDELKIENRQLEKRITR